jgi:hypothetical protein
MITFRRMTVGSMAAGVVYAVVRQRGDRVMTIDYTPTDQNVKILGGMQRILTQYQPTLFLPSNLIRMIGSYTVLPNTKHLERQDIKLSDGEVISLDWLPKNYAEMNANTPIVILIPGLTSDSTAAYANIFLNYAVHEYGFRACIMNRRGYSMKYLKEELDPITLKTWIKC